jgi:N-acetylglucosamine transport system permease protein
MKAEKRRFIVGALILPLAVFITFMLSPYVQAMAFSFTDWKGFSNDRSFVGLDNYVRLFHDSGFWSAARNNLIMAIALPLITISMALFFAAMINFGGSGRARRGIIRGIRGAAFYNVVYFFPLVLSIAITAVLFESIYNPRNGILNGLLDAVGLGSLKQVWLGNASTALWAVIAMMVWSGVGFFVVLLSAAMANVPREMYEAALLDGVSRFQAFWYVTLPMIREAVLLSVIYTVIGALDGFGAVQIMTVGPGGPAGSTDNMALHMYNTAFTYNQYGYASAMGVLLCAMTVLVAALALWRSRRHNNV